jgi:hypothetical protein
VTTSHTARRSVHGSSQSGAGRWARGECRVRNCEEGKARSTGEERSRATQEGRGALSPMWSAISARAAAERQSWDDARVRCSHIQSYHVPKEQSGGRSWRGVVWAGFKGQRCWATMRRCERTRSETALQETNDSGRRVPSPTTAAARGTGRGRLYSSLSTGQVSRARLHATPRPAHLDV